jgi:hypothetical protein
VPMQRHGVSMPLSTSSKKSKKPWQHRMPFIAKSRNTDSEEVLSRANTRASHRTATSGNTKWWKVQLFRGMINDVNRRAPYYLSDWTDAWDYRVIPATIYMYFAKYVPATSPKLLTRIPSVTFKQICYKYTPTLFLKSWDNPSSQD